MVRASPPCRMQDEMVQPLGKCLRGQGSKCDRCIEGPRGCSKESNASALVCWDWVLCTGEPLLRAALLWEVLVSLQSPGQLLARLTHWGPLGNGKTGHPMLLLPHAA